MSGTIIKMIFKPSPSINELRELITSQFQTKPLPTSLTDYSDTEPLPSTSDYQSDEQAAYQALRSHSWPEIDYDYLKTHFPQGNPHEVFFYISDEAFCYFLPAFMLMAIEATEDMPLAGIDAAASLLIMLNDVASGQNYMVQRLSRLTDPQKAVIAKFLLFIQSVYVNKQLDKEANAAYDHYWYQFDPERKEPPQPPPNPQ